MRLLFSFFVIYAYAFGITIEEIATQIDKRTSGFQSSVSVLKMTISDKSGRSIEKEMELKTLEKKEGSKALLEFLSPADAKGTKLLTHQNLDKDDDQWLYMPVIKRVKRISGRGKSGSFMGSEFTYEDLSTQDKDKFSFNDKVEEVVIDGVKYYKGERVSKESSTTYSKQIIYVTTDNFLISKVEYYDKNGSLLKVATMSDYKETKGHFRVGKVVMKNVQKGSQTTIEWVSDKIFANLKDKDFDKRVLDR